MCLRYRRLSTCRRRISWCRSAVSSAAAAAAVAAVTAVTAATAATAVAAVVALVVVAALAAVTAVAALAAVTAVAALAAATVAYPRRADPRESRHHVAQEGPQTARGHATGRRHGHAAWLAAGLRVVIRRIAAAGLTRTRCGGRPAPPGSSSGGAGRLWRATRRVEASEMHPFGGRST